jgi:L-asparagine oxygenase
LAPGPQGHGSPDRADEAARAIDTRFDEEIGPDDLGQFRARSSGEPGRTDGPTAQPGHQFPVTRPSAGVAPKPPWRSWIVSVGTDHIQSDDPGVLSPGQRSDAHKDPARQLARDRAFRVGGYVGAGKSVALTDDEGNQWPIRDAATEALVLSDQDHECIRRVAGAVAHAHRERSSGSHLDDSQLMLDCTVRMLREGPERLARALMDFRQHSNADGMLLLRNLPLDEPLPATPSDGDFEDDWRRLAVCSITQLLVMNVLGDVISYADEKAGRTIQDVVPVCGREFRQENSGSCFLELHTEDGFHPQRPRFISLLALRADHDRSALTLSGGIRRALSGLDGGTRYLLARPIYRIRLSSSFAGECTAQYSGPVAVLSGSPIDPDLCVDFHAMTTDDPEGLRALARLRRAMLSTISGLVLQPGDLLIVDNDKAVHGRTGFRARYDGQDRWLRRCFAVPDLRRSTADRIPASHVHRGITFPAPGSGAADAVAPRTPIGVATPITQAHQPTEKGMATL